MTSRDQKEAAARDTVERTYLRIKGVARIGLAKLDSLCASVAKAGPRNLRDVVEAVEQIAAAEDRMLAKNLGGAYEAASVVRPFTGNPWRDDVVSPELEASISALRAVVIDQSEPGLFDNQVIKPTAVPQPVNGVSSNVIQAGVTPPGIASITGATRQVWNPLVKDLADPKQAALALIDVPLAAEVVKAAKKKLREIDGPRWSRDMAPPLPAVRGGIDGREPGER